MLQMDENFQPPAVGVTALCEHISSPPCWPQRVTFLFTASEMQMRLTWVIPALDIFCSQRPALRSGGVTEAVWAAAAGALAAAGPAEVAASGALAGFLLQAASASIAAAQTRTRFILNPPVECPASDARLDRLGGPAGLGRAEEPEMTELRDTGARYEMDEQ